MLAHFLLAEKYEDSQWGAKIACRVFCPSFSYIGSFSHRHAMVLVLTSNSYKENIPLPLFLSLLILPILVHVACIVCITPSGPLAKMSLARQNLPFVFRVRSTTAKEDRLVVRD